MTTPQDMPDDVSDLPEADPKALAQKQNIGILYSFMTRLVAWVAFMVCLSMLIGLITFLGLGLYRGIIWLWPGGPLG